MSYEPLEMLDVRRAGAGTWRKASWRILPRGRSLPLQRGSLPCVRFHDLRQSAATLMLRRRRDSGTVLLTLGIGRRAGTTLRLDVTRRHEAPAEPIHSHVSK